MKKVFSNKIILYVLTRYLTYFIQFITSILIAVKLGPYYFGIWGFILLLINYFQITNFGISNSLNILMIHNKNDEPRVKNYVSTSLVLIGLLGIAICLFAVYYYLFGIPLLTKYNIGNLLFFICLISILIHFNSLFQIIYRVKNRLFEVAFFQSLVPLLVFIALFFAKDRSLLIILLAAYLLGHGLSVFIFIKGKQIPMGGKPNFHDTKTIFNKGLYLFVYHICFYLIIVSTRTIVSVYYSVEEFGFFTFSYTLAHSLLLLLDAMTFIIFPKLIDRLNSTNPQFIEATLKALKINYVTLSHGLVYIALLLFPVLLTLIPKYQNSNVAFNLIALTVALNTNFFGYSSFLMARNKEKTIARISIIGLLINIGFALGLVYYFHVKYEYVVISTLISYLIYSYLCVFYSKKLLRQETTLIKVIQDSFPVNLLIPFIVAFIIILINNNYLLCLPLLIFIMMNFQLFGNLKETIKKVVSKPDFINISE